MFEKGMEGDSLLWIKMARVPLQVLSWCGRVALLSGRGHGGPENTTILSAVPQQPLTASAQGIPCTRVCWLLPYFAQPSLLVPRGKGAWGQRVSPFPTPNISSWKAWCWGCAGCGGGGGIWQQLCLLDGVRPKALIVTFRKLQSGCVPPAPRRGTYSSESPKPLRFPLHPLNTVALKENFLHPA